MESDSRSQETFSSISQTCALITVGIAFIAIMGWVLDWWILARISMEYIPMAPSTTLVFILLGSAVFAHTRWPAHHLSTQFPRTTAILSFLLGLLILIQHISQIVVTVSGDENTVHVGLLR